VLASAPLPFHARDPPRKTFKRAVFDFRAILEAVAQIRALLFERDAEQSDFVMDCHTLTQFQLAYLSIFSLR
jgi:hypothetical protein